MKPSGETRPRSDLSSAPQVIDDRYELLELIGTGGMAEVWRALDQRLRRDVALKILIGPGGRDESRRKRVAREARALAALSHPNIVAVYDYGEATGSTGEVLPYIAMELVEGPDLQAYVDRHGPRPIGEARELLTGVLTAVQRAHAAGIVHGDLKAANVLIDNGVPKVGDFGVARIFSEETGTTTVAATPSFAAPEVLRGERATEASDIYSAACLAYQILTGRPPYEGSNAWEVAAKHMEDPVPHATQLREDVPIQLDEAVRHGMEKTPSRRFASAAEFREAITGPQATVAMSSGASAVAPARDPTEVISLGPDLRAAVLYGPFASWTGKASARWRALRHAVRRSRPVQLALVAVALLLAIPLILSLRSAETVEVPDVSGQTSAAGAALLRQAGLEVQGVSYTPITSGEPGRIVRTIPEARAVVPPGTNVHVVATALAAPTPTPAPAAVQSETASEGQDRSGGGGKRGRGERERD